MQAKCTCTYITDYFWPWTSCWPWVMFMYNAVKTIYMQLYPFGSTLIGKRQGYSPSNVLTYASNRRNWHCNSDVKSTHVLYVRMYVSAIDSPRWNDEGWSIYPLLLTYNVTMITEDGRTISTSCSWFADCNVMGCYKHLNSFFDPMKRHQMLDTRDFSSIFSLYHASGSGRQVFGWYHRVHGGSYLSNKIFLPQHVQK